MESRIPLPIISERGNMAATTATTATQRHSAKDLAKNQANPTPATEKEVTLFVGLSVQRPKFTGNTLGELFAVAKELKQVGESNKLSDYDVSVRRNRGTEVKWDLPESYKIQDGDVVVIAIRGPSNGLVGTRKARIEKELAEIKAKNTPNDQLKEVTLVAGSKIERPKFNGNTLGELLSVAKGIGKIDSAEQLDRYSVTIRGNGGKGAERRLSEKLSKRDQILNEKILDGDTVLILPRLEGNGLRGIWQLRQALQGIRRED